MHSARSDLAKGKALYRGLIKLHADMRTYTKKKFECTGTESVFIGELSLMLHMLRPEKSRLSEGIQLKYDHMEISNSTALADELESLKAFRPFEENPQ